MVNFNKLALSIPGRLGVSSEPSCLVRASLGKCTYSLYRLRHHHPQHRRNTILLLFVILSTPLIPLTPPSSIITFYIDFKGQASAKIPRGWKSHHEVFAHFLSSSSRNRFKISYFLQRRFRNNCLDFSITDFIIVLVECVKIIRIS